LQSLTDGQNVANNPGMPGKPVCPKCLAHEKGKRHDKPHVDLQKIDSTHTKGGGMYGGGGTTTTYRCKVCGATVTHSNDKLDFPDYWTVHPAGQEPPT
jgi:hypothetical protein